MATETDLVTANTAAVFVAMKPIRDRIANDWAACFRFEGNTWENRWKPLIKDAIKLPGSHPVWRFSDPQSGPVIKYFCLPYGLERFEGFNANTCNRAVVLGLLAIAAQNPDARHGSEWRKITVDSYAIGTRIDRHRGYARRSDESLLEEATKIANDEVGKFVTKLAARLSKVGEITSASVSGEDISRFSLNTTVGGHGISFNTNIKHVARPLKNGRYTNFYQWPSLAYLEGKRITVTEIERLEPKAVQV